MNQKEKIDEPKQLHEHELQQTVVINIPLDEIPFNSKATATAVTFDEEDYSKYTADNYRICPPPLFIFIISLVEVGVFVYDTMTTKTQYDPSSGSIPAESLLIYRPDRRHEIWRFITYMVLHANWFHLGFNIVVQLIIGLPLEMVHGSIRIAAIYFAGVFAGSLGTSVVEPLTSLVGASGGVYALLAAHFANVLLNFNYMKYGILKLASILIFASCDLGYAIYTHYSATPTNPASPSVSYVAHLSGSLAGLTIGILVLRNFESEEKSRSCGTMNLIWWTALGVYTAFTIFAIVFNLINTITAQILEERGEVMRQRLFDDLGVS